MGINKVSERTSMLDGESHLSVFDRMIWALTYACTYRFQCPVIFSVFGPNAPAKLNQEITFFVPKDNPMAQQCADFLRTELESQERAPQDLPTGWFFGVTVDVKLFDGIDFYLDHSDLEALSAGALNDLARRLSPKTLN